MNSSRTKTIEPQELILELKTTIESIQESLALMSDIFNDVQLLKETVADNTAQIAQMSIDLSYSAENQTGLTAERFEQFGNATACALAGLAQIVCDIAGATIPPEVLTKEEEIAENILAHDLAPILDSFGVSLPTQALKQMRAALASKTVLTPVPEATEPCVPLF